jgi:hypothetical protein
VAYTNFYFEVSSLGREVDECFKLFDREVIVFCKKNFSTNCDSTMSNIFLASQGTGQIQMNNFRSILRHVGEPKMSDADVDEMIKEVS